MTTLQPPTVIGSGPLQVAILDDYPLLSPSYIKSLPEDTLSKITVTIFRDNISPSPDTLPALIDRLRPFSVITTMRERTPFPSSLISQLPNLKYLLTTGMRNLSLDIPAFSSHGIIVSGTNAPAVPSGGVAATTQHTWSLILSLASNIPRDDHETRREGKWLSSTPLNVTLSGKTLGLLGLGKLGGETARIGLAFGLKVIGWSENLTQEKADALSESQGLGKGVYEAVSKQELFKQADVLSVHVVLGDRTRGVVGEGELGWMKKSALLINTSRGPIVQEDALLETLQRGGIRGAAVDVFDPEPLPLDSPWRTTKWGEEGRSQVIVTPHSGYAYEETLDTMWKGTVANLNRYINGEEVLNRLT